MVMIVSGNSLGLDLAAGSPQVARGLGNGGGVGGAGSGEQAAVNLANGNLVLQRQDDFLASVGADTQVLRTYNSQGLLNDDNADNWFTGAGARVVPGTGVAGAVGSTLVRTGRDGAQSTYTWDAARAAYVGTDGAGAYDLIKFDASTYTWTDGDTGLVERYDRANGGRLLDAKDMASGGLTSYTYNANGTLASVLDASGETTYYDYNAANLLQISQIRTVTTGNVVHTRVRYTYDSTSATGRLASVVVDLSPDDNSVADNKVFKTSYTYDGTSNRVATLTQSDGNNVTVASLSFTYYPVDAGGKIRIKSITDAAGTTGYAYDTVARTTTVTDALLQKTVYSYDAAGQLTQIVYPAVNGLSATSRFAYDAKGNLTRSIDAQGFAVEMEFDANGNQTLQRDAAGNTVLRSFDALSNRLLTETLYASADPDGAGAAQAAAPLTTRYVYDGTAKNLLRFVISPQGRVTEYSYDGQGQRTASLQYAQGNYNLAGLAVTDVPTLAVMTAWSTALTTKAQAQRSDMSYDARGQLKTLTTYASVDASGVGVAAGAATTQYFYDPAGLLLKTIAGADTTVYTYDGLGRQLSSTNALSQKTLTSYDDGNNKTSVTLANNLTTTSVFDKAGRLVSLVQSGPGAPNLGTTQYFYDANGQLAMTQDPSGVRNWRLYDEAGRQVADIDGTGSLTEYVYDVNNRRTQSIAYATAVNTATLVDANGQPTRPTLASLRPGATVADQKNWRVYDAAGRVSVAIDALGAATRNWYDGAGRLVKTTQYATLVNTTTLTAVPALGALGLVASEAKDRTTVNHFDADGLLRATVDAEGYLTERRYNDAGQQIDEIRYAQRLSAAQIAASLNLLPATLVDAPSPLAAPTGLPPGIITQARYIYIRKNEGVNELLAVAELRVLDASGLNLALGKAVTASTARPETTYARVNAVDGNNSSSAGIFLSADSEVGWLQVDLGAVYNISQIEVIGRTDTSLTQDGQFTVYAGKDGMGGKTAAQLDNDPAVQRYREDSNNAGVTINTVNALTATPAAKPQPLPVITQARYIYIRKNDGVAIRLAIGELQVLDANGNNLALGKTPTSSGAADSVFSLAMRATDGLATSTPGVFQSAAVGGGWLQLDLGSVMDIAQINVIGRTDANLIWNGQFTVYTGQTSLAGLTTTVLDNQVGVGRLRVAGNPVTSVINAANPLVLLPASQIPAQAPAPAPLPTITQARYIYIRKNDGVNIRLHLAEVQVMDANGVNIALGKTATGSTPYNASYAASTVIDGNPATILGTFYTSQATAGGWVQIDLGSIQNISQILILGRHDEFKDQNGQFTVYTSASAMGNQTHAQLANAAGVSSLRESSNSLNLNILRAAQLGLTPQANPLAALGVLPSTTADDIRSRNFYDARGQLAGTIDAEGYLTEVSFDAKGRPVQTTRYATPVAAAALSAATPTTTLASLRPAANAQDRVTTTTYDALDRIATVTNAEGTITQYSYDSVGHLLQTTVAATTTEVRTSASRYDLQGRLIGELTPEGAAALALLGATPTQAQVDTIWTQYGLTHTVDAAGRRIASTDQNGFKTLFFYDADNRLTHTVNALGEASENQYNTLGQLSAQVRYATRITPAALATLTGGLVSGATATNLAAAIVKNVATDSTLKFTYNSTGTLAQRLDALGFAKNYVYNSFGEQTGVTETTVSGQTTTNVNSYDRRGLVTGQVRDAGAAGVTLNLSSSAVYDAFGRLTSSTDAMGNVQSQTYDRLGRTVTTTDALSKITSTTTYDAFDRVVSQTDALGKTTSYLYNQAARSLTITTPELITVTTVHNRHGQTVSMTDGNGVTTTTTFDANGRVLTVNTPVTTPAGVAQTLTTQNTYDRAGQLLTSTDASGVRTDLAYDAAGRVLSRTVDPTGLALKTSYSFDALGRQLTVTDPTGLVTQLTYDLAGQLKTQTVDPTGLNLVTSYTYDARGNTLTVTSGGTLTQYSFDAAGRRVLEQIDPAGLNITRRTSFDANDNVIRVDSGSGGAAMAGAAVLSSTRYTYDANGRLAYTLQSVGTSGQAAVTRNLYDANGQRIQQIRYANTVAMTADPATVVANAAADQTQLWAYDKNGRQVFAVDAAGAVTAQVLDGNGRTVATKQYAAVLSAATLATLRGNPADATATTAAIAAAVPATLGALDRISHTVYDAAGRAIYNVDAEGGITQTTFDGAGRAIQSISYARATDPLALADKATAAQVAVKLVLDPANDRTTRSYFDAAGRQRFEIDALGYATETRYTLGTTAAPGSTTTTVRYAQKPAGIAAGPGVSTATVATALTALASDTNNHSSTVRRDAAGRVFETVDAMGVVTRRVLDARGRTTSETQAFGLAEASTTTYIYNTLDLVTSKTVAAGTTAAATTLYNYDALGHLTRQTEPVGVALQADNAAWAQYERQRLGYPVGAASLTAAQKTALLNAYTTVNTYDVAGRLTQTTNALGAVTTTQYDAFGNAVKITDPNGNAGFFYYDRLNRVALQVDPEGYATQTSYWNGNSDQIASVLRYATKVAVGTTEATVPTLSAVPAKDGLTSYTYDRLDRVLSTTERVGTGTATESVQYRDAAGNRFNQVATNKLGGTQASTVDQLGRTTAETIATSSTTNIVNAYQVDAFGNRLTTIEAQGRPEVRTTTYRYDKAGRVTYRIGQAYAAFNVATNTSSNVTPVEQSFYDALGRVIETRNAVSYDGTNTTSGSRTLSYYDAQGHQTASLAADGAYTIYTLDAAGNRLTQAAYANRIALPASTNGTAASAPAPTANTNNEDRITRATFDALGRQTSLSRDAVVYWEAGSDGLLTLTSSGPASVVLQKTVFDAAGNVLRTEDGRGNFVYSYYDKLGRKTLQIDQEVYATAWDYADFQSVATRETRYSTQLAAGFRVLQTSSAQAVSMRAAIPAGSIVPDRITEVVIDTTGHVLERRVKNVVSETTDAAGVVSKGTFDAVTAYSIDGLGHVTQLRERVTGNDTTNVTNTTDISYDWLGREIQRQAPGYVDVTTGANVRPTSNTEYNGLGAVSRSIQRGSNPTPTVETDDRITSFQYNVNGDRIGQTDAEGNQTQFDFDAQGRVARVTLVGVLDAAGVRTNQTTTYLYDAMGRQIKSTDSGVDGTGEVRQVAYNAFGEITGKALGDIAPALWQEFAEYNTLGKVQKNNSGDGVTKITLYDRNGNATRQIKSPSQSLAGVAISAAAADLSLVHSFSVYDRKNQLLKTVEPDISYLKDIVSIKQAFTQQLAPLYGGITIVDAAGGAYAGAAGYTGPYMSTTVGSVGQSGLLPNSNSPGVSSLPQGLDGYTGPTALAQTAAFGVNAINVNRFYRASYSSSTYLPVPRTSFQLRVSDQVWGNRPLYTDDQTIRAAGFDPAVVGGVFTVGYRANSLVQFKPNPNLDFWVDLERYSRVEDGLESTVNISISTTLYNGVYIPQFVGPGIVSYYEAIINEGQSNQQWRSVTSLGSTGYNSIDLSGLADGTYSLSLKAFDGNGMLIGGEKSTVSVGNGVTFLDRAAMSAPAVRGSGTRLIFDKFAGGLSPAPLINVRPYQSAGPYLISGTIGGGSIGLADFGLPRNQMYEYVLTVGQEDWYGWAYLDGNGNVWPGGDGQYPGTIYRMSGRNAGLNDRGQKVTLYLDNTLLNKGNPADYYVDIYFWGSKGAVSIPGRSLSSWNVELGLDTDLAGLGANAFEAGVASYNYTVYRRRDFFPEMVGFGAGWISYGASAPSSQASAQTFSIPKGSITLPAGIASIGPVTVVYNSTTTVFNPGDWRAALDTASGVLTLDLSMWRWQAGDPKVLSISFKAGADTYSGTMTMDGNGRVTTQQFTRSSASPDVKLTVTGSTSLSVLKVGRADASLGAVGAGLVSTSGSTFTWNASSQQTQGGSWRYYYEALGSAGNLVGKGYGTLTVNADGSLVSTPDAPLLVPSIVTFTPPAGASTFTLQVRPKGSTSAYTNYNLTSLGFKFDASTLRPGSGSADFEYLYVTTNSSGDILSKGSGVITINSNGSSSATLTLARQPTKINLQSPPGRRVPQLSFSYRAADSTGAYSTVTIAGVWNDALNATVFTWDASAIAPETGTSTFEYQMRMQNADGTDYENEVGDPVTAEGQMVLGGNTGAPLSFQQYVQTLSVAAQVKHMQTFNAFGEVITEYDDRVKERMQAMVDYYKALPEYAGEASVQNATANAAAATIKSSYNTLGQLISKTDPQTWVTSETGVHSRVAPVTTYGYDLLGRLNTSTDANNHTQRQSFLGSSGELLTNQWAADGGRKQFGYDVFGDARKATDELGTVTLQTYNKLSQLTQVDRTGITRVQNFTAADNLATVAGTLTDKYTYDARGQRISHTDALNQIDKTYYDSLGRVTKTVSPSGATVNYSYLYVAASAAVGGQILGVAGASVGGYQRRTTGADGRFVLDNIEYFGRTTYHQDEGGRIYGYNYDAVGQLVSQSSSLNGNPLQNILYEYYANGYIKSARDLSTRTLSRYGYDNAGNRTWESYSGLDANNVSPVDSYQNTTIAYDELNRMAHVKDLSVDVQYEYDAVGNRRAVHATYFDPLTAGFRQRDDMWYTYDAADRFTLTKGSLTAPGGQIVQGTQGVKIGYNLAGQRISATNPDGTVETYSYSQDGYLEDTKINGTLRARRRVDAIGRTLEYKEFNTDTSVRQSTRNVYSADNRLQQAKTLEGTTNYFYYTDTADTNTAATADGKGQLARTEFTPQTTGTSSKNFYTYEYWDDAKQSTIKVQAQSDSAPGWKPGVSQMVYDVNGFLKDANDVAGNRQLHYTNSATGLVMRRDETSGGKTYQHFYYYAEGKRIGDVTTDPNDKFRKSYAEELAMDLKNQPSNADRFKNFRPVTSADFDQNYEPINASYPGATATSYTVRAGDTLASIAQSLWGDAAMWYLLADANALKSTDVLAAGRVLIVPNKVTNIHNNANTFRPYDAGEMIGNVDPTLPAPPPPPGKGGCGGIGQIIMIVVAIVATVFTAGAAGIMFAGVSGSAGTFAAGLSVLGGTAGLSVGASLAIGAVAGAVGSIASQTVGMATGNVEQFSWKAVGQSALGSGITAGVGSGLSEFSAASAAAPTGSTFNSLGSAVSSGAVRAAVLAGTSAGVNMAMHGTWSWRQMGAAVVGSVAGSAAGAVVGEVLGRSTTSMFAQRLASGMAGGWASSEVTAGHNGFTRADSSVLFASALGGAVGQGFTDAPIGNNDPSSMNYVNEMDLAVDSFSPAIGNDYNSSDVQSDNVTTQNQRDALYGFGTSNNGWGLTAGGGYGLSAGDMRAIGDASLPSTPGAAGDALRAIYDEMHPPLGGSVQVADSSNASAWEILQARGRNNPMSVFNNDASTLGGFIGSVARDLTAPIGFLTDAKSRTLSVLGSQMQDMEALSRNSNASFLERMSANLTMGQMAQNYALVDSGAPTSLLDVTLAAFAAKPSFSGLYGEMKLGIRTLDEISLLGKNTQAALGAYQNAYDDAGAAFQRKLDAGSISQPNGLNFNTWKGGVIDAAARADMNAFKQMNSMDDLIVNKRLYTPDGVKDFRIPDLLVFSERTAIDGTIGLKTVNTPQIRDILSTGQVDRVILVSPNQKPVIITVDQYRATKK